MIDKAGALPAILSKVKKLSIGHGLDLRTYKRDRSVAIRRTGEDLYAVEEDGFKQETFETNMKELKGLLKKLLKKEFPRSNKIRISNFAD